jgi:anti-anti-sigma factor
MTPLEHIDFEPRGDVVLARVSGEIDLSNAARVQDRLLDTVPNTASSLVLDLSETEYLDSSGVRLIFDLSRRLASRGQKLELVVPNHSVIERVLVLTEVHQIVSISNSLDAVLTD